MSQKAFQQITKLWKNESESSYEVEGYKGMDLRDYFAVRFAPMMLKQLYDIEDYFVTHDDYDGIANDSYEMADAMLKARRL